MVVPASVSTSSEPVSSIPLATPSPSAQRTRSPRSASRSRKASSTSDPSLPSQRASASSTAPVADSTATAFPDSARSEVAVERSSSVTSLATAFFSGKSPNEARLKRSMSMVFNIEATRASVSRSPRRLSEVSVELTISA